MPKTFEVIPIFDGHWSVRKNNKEIAILPPLGTEHRIGFSWKAEPVGPETAKAVEDLLNAIHQESVARQALSEMVSAGLGAGIYDKMDTDKDEIL